MTSIGAYAFEDCSGLKEIYCYTEETPEVSEYTFSGVEVSNVMLVVPDEAEEKYRSHEIWGLFWIETPTGIDEVESSELKVESPTNEWYDLCGRKIENSQSSNGQFPKGINIIRMSDGTTRKVMVK